MTEAQAQSYRSAEATISCVHFKDGERVKIRFDKLTSGHFWFLIEETKEGKLMYPVAYPDHHLTNYSIHD